MQQKMKKEHALILLRQAIEKISDEPVNSRHIGWQCGGAYIRIAQVLEYYLSPNLKTQEGDDHAEYLMETYGPNRGVKHLLEGLKTIADCAGDNRFATDKEIAEHYLKLYNKKIEEFNFY